MNTLSSYKILVFSWNTCSLRLSETFDPEVKDNNRQGYLKDYLGNVITSWRYDCELNDFWTDLSKLIVDRNPDIVVFGFQEDRRPGSYFHSHFLPTEMPKINYAFFKRTTLMGVGVTTVKNLPNDPLVRGLRSSIYVKTELKDLLLAEESELRHSMGNEGQRTHLCSAMTRNKGAIGSYLQLPKIGRIAFLNAHLPFDASSLIESKRQGNVMIRQNALFETNKYYNNVLEDLVVNSRPQPDYVVYFGDLNYRVYGTKRGTDVEKEILLFLRPALEVASPDDDSGEPKTKGKKPKVNPKADSKTEPKAPEVLAELYQESDELHDQMVRKNIYPMMEGVDDSGPDFLPTCKLKKDRDRDLLTDAKLEFDSVAPGKCPITAIPNHSREDLYWNTGKYDQRMPSWCDRILYARTEYLLGQQKTSKLKCLEYSSLDVGKLMLGSDHAAVYAVFEIHE